MREDCSLLSMEQGTPEWKEARRAIPTASCFSQIFTSRGKPSESQDKFIYQLLAEAKRCEESWTGNRWTERGHKLEPDARAEFEMDTNLAVEQVGFCRLPFAGFFIGCSPDGLVSDRESGLEIKCRNAATHMEHADKDILPSGDKVQVHGSMVVTGCESWNYYTYHPDFEGLHKYVERTTFTDDLEEALEKFVKRLRAKAEQRGVQLPNL